MWSGSANGSAPRGTLAAGSNVLDGRLVNRVAHELRRLTAINSFPVEGAGTEAMLRELDYTVISRALGGHVAEQEELDELRPLRRGSDGF
jgi:hypothetical protein